MTSNPPAETGPARQGSTERCANPGCGHTKRDHSGRADHRERHGALVAGDPWCHACKTECLYEPPAAAPAVFPGPPSRAESVCICGHTERQHFEDVCITEITGCDCGDFLVPEAARDVIARWREAAMRKTADRAAVLLWAADKLDESERLRDLTDDHMHDVHAAANELRRLAAETQQQPETETPVVAYRSPGTRTLYCLTCARQEIGWQPVTDADEQTVCDFCGGRVHAVAAQTLAGVVARYLPSATPTTEMQTEDPARIDRMRPEFTEHASVESIDVQLRRARSQERRWHLRVEWLISLRQARVDQKARGEWPAPVEPAAADSEETRCPAKHGALGRICELPAGHRGMHTGDGPNGGAVWDGDAAASS